MGRLAAFLASFFTSTFSLFSGWMASKIGMGVAVAAVSLTITTALFLLMKSLLRTAILSVPYEHFVMGFWACWPSNGETCIAVCLGIDVAVFLYRYKVGLIESMTR